MLFPCRDIRTLSKVCHTSGHPSYHMAIWCIFFITDSNVTCVYHFRYVYFVSVNKRSRVFTGVDSVYHEVMRAKISIPKQLIWIFSCSFKAGIL